MNKHDGGLRIDKFQGKSDASLKSGVRDLNKYDSGLGPEKTDLSKLEVKMDKQPKTPVSKSNKSNGQKTVPDEKAEASELVETITGEQPKVASKRVVGVQGSTITYSSQASENKVATDGPKTSKEIETKTGLESRGGVKIGGDSNSCY